MDTIAPSAAPAPSPPDAAPFRPSPLLAFVLSFLGPTLGHVYAGRFLRGMAVWAAAHAVLLGLLVAAESLPDALRVPAVVLGFAVAFGYALDAFAAAWSVQRAGGFPRGPWQRPAVLAVLVVLSVVALGPALRAGLRLRFPTYSYPHGKMTPTLMEGDLFFARPLSGDEARRGQVVTYEGTAITFAARVAALPGDTVEMRDGVLRVNGRDVPEPYARRGAAPEPDHSVYDWQRRHLAHPADSATYRPTATTWGPLVVPAGAWFALGDNRAESLDSRLTGFLTLGAINGAPTWIYFSRGPEGVRWERIGRGVQEDGDA